METDPSLQPVREAPGTKLERRNLAPPGGADMPCGVSTGVRALMVAILEDGIRSFLSPVTRLRQEAEYWVAGRKQQSPFSFCVVCETLGLEPDAVATAILRMRTGGASAPRPIRRSRPNVRRTTRLRADKSD
jgi:hypothetical protein